VIEKCDCFFSVVFGHEVGKLRWKFATHDPASISIHRKSKFKIFEDQIFHLELGKQEQGFEDCRGIRHAL